MQKFLRRLERFSQSLLSPLSYLSAAGLLLVLGALLTSKPLCQAMPVLQWAPLQLVGQLLYNGMMVLINNLSVILCVGVAAVRAKTEKQDAALLALMAYLVFLTWWTPAWQAASCWALRRRGSSTAPAKSSFMA